MNKNTPNEKIIVRFDAEGNPVIEVEGVKGTSCTDLTRELEAALGAVDHRVRKQAYRETEEPVNARTKLRQ